MAPLASERLTGLPAGVLEETVTRLEETGASFALVHGSRARGTHRPDSDLDVAAWWGAHAPQSFEVSLPPRVDLLVLDRAPLELAGRIAQEGLLILERDPAERVRWVATTRKIWADEKPRYQRAHRDFVEAILHGR